MGLGQGPTVKILILKPSSLGDVVQALPVLRLLKASDRRHELYWWISADLAEVLQDDPDLAGVFVFNRRRWASPRHWGEILQSVRQLRRERFDWVIDLQGLARSSLVAWLAGGRFTAGVEDWREGAPAFYDLAVPRPSFYTHAVDWYLEVVRRLHVPVHWDFTWLPPRPGVAGRLREKWPIGDGRWLVVNPGARWSNKRWPAASFAQVLQRLAARWPDLRFAVLGAASDSDAGRVICQAAADRCLDLTGRTSLSEMIEWIRLSELVLTNDTGPMHIAAAMGKPVVALFGPTEPRRTGPYGQGEHVIRLDLPCVPCLKPSCQYQKPLECLRGIDPAQVSQAVERRLAVNTGLSPHVD